MLIYEKYKIIKKGFNPPFNGKNPKKWPKILISRNLNIFKKSNFHSILDFLDLEEAHS